jgi:hypothetical protein
MAKRRRTGDGAAAAVAKEERRRTGAPRTPGVARLARQVEQERAAAYAILPEAGVERTVKVVAEGDSWFSYLPAHDILARLRGRVWNGWAYEVEDRARAGALLNDMVYGRDLVDTYELIQKHSPDVVLFSGGGNDIAGQELFVMLYHHQAVRMHGTLPRINQSVLRGVVSEVFSQAYHDLIGLLRFKLAQVGRPDVPIVFHGYGYAIPDGRGWAGGIGPLPGPWLDPPLTRKGYDREQDAALRREIVRELIDAFNQMLQGIAATHPHTHHVDLRPVLGDQLWSNELHPSKRGFFLAARKIEETIRRLLA